MLLTLLLLAPLPTVPVPPHATRPVPVVRQDVQPPSYDQVEAEALAQVQVQLEELAESCQKSRAFLQRNHAYQALLAWAPDHKAARKVLGWKWNKKSSEWTQKRKPRVPKDHNKEKADQAAAERGQLLSNLRETLLAALDADPAVTPAKRREVLDMLLRAMPEDNVLRQRNGQVRGPKSTDAKPVWILEASDRALVKRKELATLREQLFAEDAEATTVELTDSEERLGMAWAAVLGNGRVRALATGGSAEAERALHACSVAIDYTRELFGHKLHPNFNLYLVDTEVERDQFFEAWPGLDEERRERYRRMDGSSLGVEHKAAWGDLPENRIDSVLRQSISTLMSQRFGVSDNHAWVHEGFGMYLTHDLVGTRLNFFIKQSEYVDDEADDRVRELHDPDSDWLKMARIDLESDKATNLAITLGRPLNELTPMDLVLSYALASFFMEGHDPSVTQALLVEIGNGKNPILTVEKVLGYDIPTLEERLHAFLVETGS